jgi:hypothetical protein
VITFAVSRGGYARYAKYAPGAPVFPEITEDIPPAIDQTAQTFRLATPLVAPPAGLTSAAEFVGAIAGISASGALRERADAIYKAAKPNYPTADEFWKALNEGEVWTGEHSNRRSIGPASDLPLTIVPAAWTPALFSPLMTKLYEESNLRLAPNAIALHPEDAAGRGPRAVLQTRLGRCTVQVTVDATVPRDICIRGERAKVVQARVCRGLPHQGDSVRRPGEAAAPGRQLPAAGIARHRAENLLPLEAGRGARHGRCTRKGNRPWISNSSLVASGAARHRASCCGSLHGSQANWDAACGEMFLEP